MKCNKPRLQMVNGAMNIYLQIHVLASKTIYIGLIFGRIDNTFILLMILNFELSKLT